MMRWLKRGVVLAVAIAALAYGAVAALVYSQQRSLLFRPDATRIAPADAGLPVAREITFAAPGGPSVIAWRIPPRDAAQPVVLYLHGNARNLGRRADRFQRLTANGAGLLALSWRGYGGSDGEPSEAGFMADVRAALDLLARDGIGPERVVIFGESLGTGVAVMIAAERPVRGVILDSPYDSIAAIAAERYWWLPVNALIRDPFRAIAAAPRVKAPVLALACTDDWLTPYAGAQRLMAALPGAKRLITVDRRCHIPGFAAAGDAIMRFVETGRL
jgi:uncharacterized protein